jgi:hypothetical protein
VSVPSQFSSIPLPHISASGVLAVHPTYEPATHISVPLHVPYVLVLVQDQVNDSSVKLSQSSSRLLHISMLGYPGVALHTFHEDGHAPAVHILVCVPLR